MVPTTKSGFGVLHRALGSCWTALEWMEPGPHEVVQGLWPFNGGGGKQGMGAVEPGDQSQALPSMLVTANGAAAAAYPVPGRWWPLPSSCLQGWGPCYTGGHSSRWR